MLFLYLSPALNRLFLERDTPKGANIVMELWATLEELYVGNFVEVGYTFTNILCSIYRCFLPVDDSQQAGSEGSQRNAAL